MTTTDVKSLLGRKCIFLAIDDHNAIALAAVHHTNLTVIEEILLFDCLIDIKSQFPEVLEFQSLVYRHSSAEDEAVVV